MKLGRIKKKTIFIAFVIALIASLSLFQLYYKNLFSAKMVMGGMLYKQTFANIFDRLNNPFLMIKI